MIEIFGPISLTTVATAAILAVFYDGPVKAFGRWVLGKFGRTG